MFYGSIIFVGATPAINRVETLVSDGTIVTPNVLEVEGPIDAGYDPASAMYTVEFDENSWIDIFSLRDELASLDVDVEIIHALTDGHTYIEVLSTTGEYDTYEQDDDAVLDDLTKEYNLNFSKGPEDDISDEDYDEEDELYDVDEYDEWN